MKQVSTAMTTPKTRRLKEAIPSKRFVLKVLANEIRVAREKTPIGTCSKTGSGKRSRRAIRHEAKVRDRHPVAATEIAVAEVEIAADGAGTVADVAVAVGVAGIAVDGTNGLARPSRHVRKSVRAVTNLGLLRQPPRLLAVNRGLRLLGRDVTTARAMIVARELNADLIVTRAVTSRDQPLRVNRRLQQMFPMILVRVSLKNSRRPHGHLPF